MTWDLTEAMVVAAVNAAGHDLRQMDDGLRKARCETCGYIFAIGARALSARGERRWGTINGVGDPLTIDSCVGHRKWRP